MTPLRSESWTKRHRDPYSLLALAVLAMVAPQLLGGAPAWATLTLAILATGVVGVVSFSLARHPGRNAVTPRQGVNWVVLALTAALGVSLAHALPLPASFARGAGLDAYEHAVQTALGLGIDSPKWIAYTLDPASTHERILYGIAVVAAFWAAHLYTAKREGTSILKLVAGSAILIGIAHAGHTLFEATRVYGMYRPTHARPLGPLLNPNNLAGFMAMAFPICIGLAVKDGRHGLRWLWLLGATMIGATAMLSRSRGGLGALLGSGFLFGYFWLLNGRQRRTSARRGPQDSARTPPRAWEVAVLLLLLVGIAFGLAALAADQFVDSDFRNVSKLELFQAQLRALRGAPLVALFGAGRGSFSTFVSGHYGPGRAYHAENLLLQYAIEFGVPLTLLMFGVLGTAIGRALWVVNAPAKLGGLVAVITVVLQNLVDFSLELTGIAVPAAMCLAASLPTPAVEPNRAAPSSATPREAGLFGMAASVVLIALVGPSALAHDTQPLLASLKEQLNSGDVATFRTNLRRGAMAHPADPALAILAASESVLHGRRDAPFWLNRSMSLAPHWSSPHLWAANWLASQGRSDQVMTELSLAGELDVFVAVRDICEWVQHRPTAEIVLAIAPRGEPARSQVLDAGARCLYSLPKEAHVVDVALLTADPNHVAANLRAMHRELSAGDYQAVVRRARTLRARSPQVAGTYKMEAEALAALGQLDRSVRLLVDASTHVDDRGMLLIALAEMQTRNQDADGMRNSIEQLRMAAAGQVAQLSKAAALLGHLERRLGNDARALRALREAYKLRPETQYLVSAANIATKLGQLEYALSAWRQLCSEKPEAQEYCRKRDALVNTVIRN